MNESLHTRLLAKLRERHTQRAESTLPIPVSQGIALELGNARGVRAALLEAPRRYVRVIWDKGTNASALGEGHLPINVRVSVFDADAGMATLLVHRPDELYVLTVNGNDLEELVVPAASSPVISDLLPDPDWEAWQAATPDPLLQAELRMLRERDDDLATMMAAALLDNYHEGKGSGPEERVARLHAGLPVSRPTDVWLEACSTTDIEFVAFEALHAVHALEEALEEAMAQDGAVRPADLPTVLREERDRLECVWRTLRRRGFGDPLRRRLKELDASVLENLTVARPETATPRLVLAATFEPEGWWTATGGVLDLLDEEEFGAEELD